MDKRNLIFVAVVGQLGLSFLAVQSGLMMAWYGIEGWGYARAYADAERMLAEEAIDAVVVATIHDQLQPCGLAAVSAGKHLFIEKPMALNAADGRALATAARSAPPRPGR